MNIPESSLNKINFPLYSISPLSSNHVIVSGGGGNAKTGIYNGFAICEIVYDEKRGYVAYEIQRHDTGELAVMNSAIGSNGKKIFLAAGKDADCYIYQLKLITAHSELTKPKSDNSEGNLRQRVVNGDTSGRRDSLSPDINFESSLGGFTFDIQTIHSVKTDYSSVDPSQNAVIFSQDNHLLVTGGADGTLRIWNFPEMKQRSQIEASKKEIADIDISPDRKFVSCVSKDGKCRIYSLGPNHNLVCSLDLPPKDEGKFNYKRCKFGLIEEKRGTSRLFAILNPTNYKANKSYIQQWTGPPFSLTRVSKPAGELLSALAVSRCGKYLAVGSMTEGDVDIYISFSLQRVKHIERAHRTFVTGLSFLPPAEGKEESVLADCDAAVVSISIDNQVLVHFLDKTKGISMWLAVLLVLFTLFMTFSACSYFGL